MKTIHRKGFSLASLLLLTAVAAVLLAAVSTLWIRSADEPAELDRYYDSYEEPKLDRGLTFVCVAGGILVGAVVGLVVGAGRVRPLRGVLVGTPVGMVAGAITGLLLAVPDKMLPIGVGSLVIVVFSLIVRRYSGSPPE